MCKEGVTGLVAPLERVCSSGEVVCVCTYTCVYVQTIRSSVCIASLEYIEFQCVQQRVSVKNEGYLVGGLTMCLVFSEPL